MSPYGYATFRNVPFAPSTELTASALAADASTVLATHTARSWAAPAALLLTLDAPSLATGTGAALFLDGGDVALVRARVVDANGVLCGSAALPLLFSVTEGPGVVWGTGNGDPSNQQDMSSAATTAYHGLARAVVRAAMVAAGSDADRAQLAYVNVDAGGGAGCASILSAGQQPPTHITVTVSSPGLQGASIVIPLSVDPKDSVLAVASASVGAADVGE